MFFSRGKNKIQNPITMPEMYENYIQGVEVGSPYDIPYTTYVRVVNKTTKKIIERIYDGITVDLPFKLGKLRIVKKKMNFTNQLRKNLGIDWKLTNEYGKTIHHTNDHSGGYKYLFNWYRVGSSVTNITKYRFIPTRTLKRTLARLIKEDKRDYFEAS